MLRHQANTLAPLALSSLCLSLFLFPYMPAMVLVSQFKVLSRFSLGVARLLWLPPLFHRALSKCLRKMDTVHWMWYIMYMNRCEMHITKNKEKNWRTILLFLCSSLPSCVEKGLVQMWVSFLNPSASLKTWNECIHPLTTNDFHGLLLCRPFDPSGKRGYVTK